jgi:hypothetical protein
MAGHHAARATSEPSGDHNESRFDATPTFVELDLDARRHANEHQHWHSQICREMLALQLKTSSAVREASVLARATSPPTTLEETKHHLSLASGRQPCEPVASAPPTPRPRSAPQSHMRDGRPTSARSASACACSDGHDAVVLVFLVAVTRSLKRLRQAFANLSGVLNEELEGQHESPFQPSSRTLARAHRDQRPSTAQDECPTSNTCRSARSSMCSSLECESESEDEEQKRSEAGTSETGFSEAGCSEAGSSVGSLSRASCCSTSASPTPVASAPVLRAFALTMQYMQQTTSELAMYRISVLPGIVALNDDPTSAHGGAIDFVSFVTAVAVALLPFVLFLSEGSADGTLDPVLTSHVARLNALLPELLQRASAAQSALDLFVAPKHSSPSQSRNHAYAIMASLARVGEQGRFGDIHQRCVSAGIGIFAHTIIRARREQAASRIQRFAMCYVLARTSGPSNLNTLPPKHGGCQMISHGMSALFGGNKATGAGYVADYSNGLEVGPIQQSDRHHVTSHDAAGCEVRYPDRRDGVVQQPRLHQVAAAGGEHSLPRQPWSEGTKQRALRVQVLDPSCEVVGSPRSAASHSWPTVSPLHHNHSLSVAGRDDGAVGFDDNSSAFTALDGWYQLSPSSMPPLHRRSPSPLGHNMTEPLAATATHVGGKQTRAKSISQESPLRSSVSFWPPPSSSHGGGQPASPVDTPTTRRREAIRSHTESDDQVQTNDSTSSPLSCRPRGRTMSEVKHMARRPRIRRLVLLAAFVCFVCGVLAALLTMELAGKAGLVAQESTEGLQGRSGTETVRHEQSGDTGRLNVTPIEFGMCHWRR